MSLWSNRSYLELCAKLKEIGVLPRFAEGDRIARGFADLGYEEFCMLHNSSMLSLYNGKHSVLTDDHKHFFFCVSTVEQLLNELSHRGIACEQIDYIAQRSWEISFKKGDRTVRERAAHFEEVLALGVLAFAAGAS